MIADRPTERRILVALPPGAVSLLGVGPGRAGLVGLLGLGSLAAAVAWLLRRVGSITEAGR